MKIYYRFVFLLFFIWFLTGCGGKIIRVQEGSYPIKYSHDWDRIDFKSSDNFVFKFFDDWEEKTSLQFKVDKPDAIDKYGTLFFGNQQQKFGFALEKSSRLYFDQNGDGNITGNEVHEFTVGNIILENEYFGFTAFINKLPVLVRYARNDKTCISKKIHLSFQLTYLMSVSDNKEKLDPYYLFYSIDSYFTGSVYVEGKKIEYILIDGNQNACFNDYGVDWIVFDRNQDEKFSLAREKQQLLELYQINDPAGHPAKKTLRLSLFSYPVRLVVNNAADPPPPPEMTEPEENDEWRYDSLE